jgi:Holliday junction resolvase RusA-like endonuclease
MGRKWIIDIPVRPKAVQSTRFDGRSTYVDPKVVAWKKSIIPYIEKAVNGPPSEKIIKIVRATYKFKYPKSFSKAKIKRIEEGSLEKYREGGGDLENLGKGVYDCMQKRIYKNDGQVCEYNGIIQKIYAPEDGIYMELEEIE